jgi:hypothetical protein
MGRTEALIRDPRAIMQCTIHNHNLDIEDLGLMQQVQTSRSYSGRNTSMQVTVVIVIDQATDPCPKHVMAGRIDLTSCPPYTSTYTQTHMALLAG